MKSIEELFNTVDKSLLRVDGELDYIELTEALINLANAVHAFEGDTEDIWYLGEGGECCLSDLIIGAYWHYTEWHGGQDSLGYRALSALGQVFAPGMESPETDNPAYIELESMAQQHFLGKER